MLGKPLLELVNSVFGEVFALFFLGGDLLRHHARQAREHMRCVCVPHGRVSASGRSGTHSSGRRHARQEHLHSVRRPPRRPSSGPPRHQPRRACPARGQEEGRVPTRWWWPCLRSRPPRRPLAAVPCCAALPEEALPPCLPRAAQGSLRPIAQLWSGHWSDACRASRQPPPARGASPEPAQAGCMLSDFFLG